MKGHPERKDLIQAVRCGDSSFDDHLKSCQACREIAELFASFPVTGRIHLTDAPPVLISKAQAIATEERTAGERLRDWIFDSWKMPVPAGVRGATAHRERRLVFKDFDMTFDLRAEYREGLWSFIAQITAASDSEFEILAGRKRVRSDDGGFYQWTSKRPPEKLALRSAEQTIQLPGLMWKETSQSQ